jgi:hypothetical protein
MVISSDDDRTSVRRNNERAFGRTPSRCRGDREQRRRLAEERPDRWGVARPGIQESLALRAPEGAKPLSLFRELYPFGDHFEAHRFP